jgi:Chaperone for protein-folding within the ER, fungal
MDPFHNVKRLNLYKFDGSPIHPMFLAYTPPQMLPTSTLNPTASETGTGGKPTSNSRVKRAVDYMAPQSQEPLNKNAILTPSEPFNADRWWWVGIGLTAVGTMLYMYPSS